MLLLAAGTTSACFKRLVYHGSIPLLYIDQCQSNYALGLLVGSTFSNAIRARCRDSVALAKVQARNGAVVSQLWRKSRRDLLRLAVLPSGEV